MVPYFFYFSKLDHMIEFVFGGAGRGWIAQDDGGLVDCDIQPFFLLLGKQGGVPGFDEGFGISTHHAVYSFPAKERRQ